MTAQDVIKVNAPTENTYKRVATARNVAITKLPILPVKAAKKLNVMRDQKRELMELAFSVTSIIILVPMVSLAFRIHAQRDTILANLVNVN